MRPGALLGMARTGRLYPAVILHGGSPEARRDTALELARALLCERPAEERPCGQCRHCRRLVWPGQDAGTFHPDLHVLERDLRTATSAEATRSFLREAYTAPFEARGQVFVVAEAESLSGGAADALLKLLEEPPLASPRHFLLLAATRLDLLPTLRSRSLAVFLGRGAAFEEAELASLAESFGRALDAFLATSSPVYLLSAAEALGAAPGWEDPRARRPWALAAAAVLRYLGQSTCPPAARRALLALAEAFLDGPRLRLRGIAHGRILEGLMAGYLRRLASVA